MTYTNREQVDSLPRSVPEPVADMMYEGGALGPQPPPSSPEIDARSELEPPPQMFRAWLEEVSEKWGKERLKTLVQEKGRLSLTMVAVPNNMHRVANQTKLVLELIDDFRTGAYRKVSWRSIALLVGALLYTISPADVIPDVVPIFGKMDDLAVLALVTRLVNRDLRNYCAFKGYPEEEYFRGDAQS